MRNVPVSVVLFVVNALALMHSSVLGGTPPFNPSANELVEPPLSSDEIGDWDKH